MGKHLNPRRKLTALGEEFRRWDRSARKLGLAWAEWARQAMNEKHERDEPIERKSNDAKR